MYWLIFFNGHEVPEIEAAFIVPWGLCNYIEAINEDRLEFYSVLDPNTLEAMPLKNFLEKHKEN